MYSGLLPMGLTETDLSSDDEDDHLGDKPNSLTENVEKGETSLTADELDSSQTATAQQRLPPKCPLPGISQEMWQKFSELQKKKNEIKTMDVPRRRKRRKHHKKGTEKKDSTEECEHQVEIKNQWDGLKQYFGVNDRFQPPASSRPLPQSGLADSIESAIAEGDIGKAEEMSDRLATRELAVKIAQAVDCRDFVQHKQEEEASRAAQKRKKIAWGFEAKKRWETKSNMGYM